MGGLLAALLLVASGAQAASRSDFSRWVGDSVVPELRQLLSQHPRYQGQSVHIVAADHNGLADAAVTVLASNLRGREGISLYSPAPVLVPNRLEPARIDDLQCAAVDSQRLRILVSVTSSDSRKGRAQVALVEPGAAGASPHSWEWRGSFTTAETRAFRKAPARDLADGSLAAPWTAQDVESAATDLQRQLACSLRPQIETRLGLQWTDSGRLPALARDTVNRSLHLLGSYEELGFSSHDPDYRVKAEIKPFREDVWQLWLTGAPQRAPLAPVQAVTYFRAELPAVPNGYRGPVAVNPPESEPRHVPVRPGPARPGPARPGPALDYLGVEMLDAYLGKARSGRAELQVQLRLENRAEWPIDYSFSLSGGHYQHCIPEPAQYRHDRYGRLAGRLEPGQVLVRPLVIKGATHKPNPFFGARKCAGFRNLDGFEDFAGKGDTVTNYVRWGL